MRELFTQDGDGGADALEHRDGEGGTDGQTVNEVVESITQCDHPSQSPDVRVRATL